MRKTRWAAIGAAAAVAAAAAAGLAGLGYYWLVRRPLAITRGDVTLPGLREKVEVIRDDWGIPHIYAGNTHDLFFAQGYVHAQDRLWQMDSWRRVVAGRLSEIMGPQTVDVDRWMRILSMRRISEQEESLLDKDVRADLEAYAAGVNARIDQGRLPIEFKLLRYQPEPWSVVDSLSWIKMMSWWLSINWESEILRAKIIKALGPELAAELDPDYDGASPTIVLPGMDDMGLGALDRAEAARPFTGPPAHSGVGSNNWVISGSRTETGKPLLANDMHLMMSLPSIWYENHLACPDLNVSGITFPGIPGIVSGHNGHVAWGFTNGFPDVQDLFAEHLRHTDNGQVEYEFKGEWLEAQVIREEIRVKGGEPVIEEVIVTHHGPIINELVGEFGGELPLAFRWTSLDPDTMIHSLKHMMQAQNCLEFRQALQHWTAPVQNVVYADTKGNIAYSYPGKIPIRAQGRGETPVPGWTGEYEWTGYIAYQDLPHIYNPPHGYIVTANNKPVGDDYPHFLGREFALGDRAQRITELIEARPVVDAAYIKEMHLDKISVTAQKMAVHLGELEVEDPDLARVVALMAGWDGKLEAGSPAAAVHQVFTRRMLYVTLDSKLGDLAVRYAGKGPTPMLAEGSMFGGRAIDWLIQVLTEPDSHWFDLGSGETRDDLMRLALRETVDFLKAECGPNIEDWAWGKLHTLTYGHMLAAVKPLDRLFNRGPYPIGGDGTTVCATGASRSDLDTDSIIAAPFRFIADLSDLSKSEGLLVPGQSGQPGSAHYDDQIQAWFEGQYHPMLYAREDVIARAVARLELQPQ